MKPGLLNRLFVLQAVTGSVDAIGQPVGSWTAVQTFWGHIKVSNGYEAIKANATAEVGKVSIRARYPVSKVATAGMRLTHDGVTYNIQSIQPDIAGREFVDFVCEVVK